MIIVLLVIEELDLIQAIDSYLPISKEKGAKVTMGQRIAAMVLNGLGFMDNRLYMFPEFLANKPVERLLGAGIKAEDFNDDALGRCLDAIHEFGPTQLFSHLAFSIGVQHNLLGKSAHFDTSSLSVFGEYDTPHEEEQEENPKSDASQSPHITHGYSKDHRPDLKQVVINLATTGAAGFPIWFESHSGNASDKKVLREAAERMQIFCKGLKAAPSFLYVADSAMYESCLKKGGSLLWLSRVPERLKEAKSLLQQSDANFDWQPLGEGYRFHVIETQCGGLPQRWCIISSEKALKRELKTLEKKIEKEKEQFQKLVWHLGCQTFACKQDAELAAKKLNKGLKFHSLAFTFEKIMKHKSPGRPKPGSTPEVASYKIKAQLERNEERIKKISLQKGRFILATNQLDCVELPNKEILAQYKQQSKTESGFKFIKDNAFEVSSIFLKKESRVSSLMMVMTLCLMIYSVAQYRLRESLHKEDDTVPDQLNKPTKKPTLKRVFKLFHGVQALTIQTEASHQVLIINLTGVLKKIIRHFGPYAMMICEVT